MFDAAVRPDPATRVANTVLPGQQAAESWVDAGALLACLRDPAFAEQPGTDRLLLLSTRFGQVFLSSAAGSRAIASFVPAEDPWGGNLVVERRPLLGLLETLAARGRLPLRFEPDAGHLWLGERALRASLMTRLS